MLWPFKLLTWNKNNNNIMAHPPKTYKKIFCHKKHCTEECIVNMNQKYWIRFLMNNEIDYTELYDNLDKINVYVRYYIYKHILKIKNEEERLDYKPLISNSELNDKNNDKQAINAQIINKKICLDCELVKKIIFRCKKTKNEEFEKIFNVYKTVCDEFYTDEDKEGEIDGLILEIIYKLNNLAYSKEMGIYKIIKILIEKHGLLFKNEKSEYYVNKTDEESLNINNTINTVETDKDTINDSKIIKKEKATKIAFTISEKTIFEVFKMVVFSKNDTFLRMTDMVLSLWCTYSDLIRHAAKISLYTDADKILSVLNARGNNEYYKELTKTNLKVKIKKNKNRSDENYFDFLVIQNETIKAQENIKNELLTEIRDLKIQLKNILITENNSENDNNENTLKNNI